ncbi:MAG: ATP-binding protein [Xanthomonadales bacterium]|nr:ATP-binding protein [Xanthomonadales bacterium]
MPLGKLKQGIHPSRQNLLRLCVIRSILIVVLLSGSFWFRSSETMQFPSLPVFTILLVMVVINALVLLRLRSDSPVSEKELFANLMLDVFFLTLVLYFTGGSTNPLVSYYLIPLIISAAVLRPAHTWVITFLCISFYTLLLFYYQPLALFNMTGRHAMSNAHFLGMWVNFGFSALLISWFVVRMAGALREQAQAIADHREAGLRDEQIISVASIAAATAHEMRTPLATMAVTVDEIDSEYPQLKDETAVLAQQIARCDKVLRNLLSTTTEDSGMVVTQVGVLLKGLLEKWSLARPEIKLETTIPERETLHKIRYDHSLQHALINLLNNAADASPEFVSLQVGASKDWLQIVIEDHGPGIPADIAGSLGKTSISRKQGGLGLGVLLGQASIERLGGEVKLADRKGPGTRLEIRLPLIVT